MGSLLALPGAIAAIINVALLVVKLFAFIDALRRTGEEFRAAGKWTKTGWTILLGVAVALQLLPLFGGIVNIALTIAAFVYLADVRPAIKSLRRR